MKRFALILFSLLLAACDREGPLAKVARPNTVRAYHGQAKSVITHPAALDQLVVFLGAPERDWRRYWVTTPNPEASATFEKDGKAVASVFIGRDWVVAKPFGGPPEAYSANLTPEEHEKLLGLLGISEKTLASSSSQTPGRRE